MSMIYRCMFPMKPDDTAYSLFLLALRILFGVLLMSHGLQKLEHFAEMSATFPDPLGVGSSLSLSLAIFGELFCSAAFILGFLYRLAMLPMMFTMGVACFIVHGADPFSVKELAFVYLSVFVMMYITGPGKYSLDRLVAVALAKK